MHYQQFVNPNRKWRNNARLAQLNGWIALISISSMICGFDETMINGMQSLPQWGDYFDHPKGGRIGLLVAMMSFGGLCAYPFTPYLTDGIGRRCTILVGALLMVCGSILQVVSTSLGMLMGARFLVGFGMMFNMNAAPILVTELAYPPYRGQLTSMFAAIWSAGAAIAAWTTLGSYHISSSWAWRLPSAVQGFPSLLQVLLIWFAPESPRWLVSKGREDEALHVLAFYHADGDQHDPLVLYELQCIKDAIIEETRAIVGYKTLFATPGNRRRVRIIAALALFSQWSGISLAAYYLNVILRDIGITDAKTQLIINAVLALWNLIFSLIGASLVERAGRRVLMLTSITLLLIFFAADTACFAVFSKSGKEGNQSAEYAFVAMIFLASAAYDIGFGPLTVAYTVEILPFTLRAKGYTLFSVVISLASLFNGYVNPIALEALGWKYFVIYTCWMAFEVVFLYMYVLETRNLSLEETAALFDGRVVRDEQESALSDEKRD